MSSRESCIQKYEEFKRTHNRVPKHREFLDYANLHARKLIQIFGEDAYSKLQTACGDTANKLEMERTPLEQIMRQYGELVLELGRPPSSSVWMHRGFKPSVSGLMQQPHHIKWSEFPQNFVAWVQSTNASRYGKAVEIISGSNQQPRVQRKDREFEKLIEAVRLWSPARRRNSEGEYKIELRKHLESLSYRLNEEFGESNFDLLVNGRHAIEIKKDPNLSEYDRVFGQLARHLQHQLTVIALFLDAPAGDKFDNFVSLVDIYLNKNEKVVEVVKK